MIRNIAVLKDTTITYIYPKESNEKDIGINLAQIAEQRASVLYAKESGNPNVFFNVSSFFLDIYFWYW